jgi:hypothetical protein
VTALSLALIGGALVHGTLERVVKLEPVDVAELEHPLDPQVSANDRESVPVSADLSQRHAPAAVPFTAVGLARGRRCSRS